MTLTPTGLHAYASLNADAVYNMCVNAYEPSQFQDNPFYIPAL